MKHEAFARAMSQLDDELILQAHQDAAARQGALLWRRIRRIAAAAACLLLVLGAAWLFLPARVELTLPQPGQSVLSSEPGIAVQDMRGAQAIAAEFSVTASRTVRLAADDGIFSLTESGEETPFFEGRGSTKARGEFTVRWEIPVPEREKVYTFSVGANGKATAKLWYDAQNSAWILEKETN